MRGGEEPRRNAAARADHQVLHIASMRGGEEPRRNPTAQQVDIVVGWASMRGGEEPRRNFPISLAAVVDDVLQ